ncbi:MAG TPA: PPC domain-containing protein [Pirellulales bacterium]|nr:PPC domain-containing protein [Pirellulales bacterium]
MKYLFPAGAARGTTAEVAVGGNLQSWPLQAWVDRSGVAFAAKEEKGKFAVTVAANAAPGVYWTRIYNAEGASAPLPFVVGTLPEVVEQEPNDNPTKAQSLPGSICTINGRLEKRGDVDMFAVSLAKGQTLVAAVTANELLGSPMDTVLQVVSPRGNVLAQNDDERGLDSFFAFQAPADGVYFLRLFAFPAAPDASISFAGGESFVYRLTVTTAGYLDGALPLAVSRAGPMNVEAYGWNLADVDRRQMLQAAPEESVLEFFSPQWAGGLSLPVVESASLIEAEPDDAAHPQPLPPHAIVSGRIDAPGDRDAFRLHLTQGQTYRFKLESRSLGYPLDSVLELRDASGKTISTADDADNKADSELDFAAPADGDYVLVVSDLYGHGGPRYFYRLSTSPLEADFVLSVPQHAYTLQAGKSLEIPVTVDRRHGFAGDIEIEVRGLPEGVTASPAKSISKDDTAKSAKLVLTSTKGEFSGAIRIGGNSSAPIRRSHLTAFILPSGQRVSELWLTVTK